MNWQNTVYFILKFFPVIVFLQSGFYHVFGDEQSLYIFGKLGGEPVGRYLIGILELATVLLMILPGRSLWAGFAGLFLTTGAIIMHLTVLGIEIMEDDGYRFALACIVFVSSLGLVIISRNKLAQLFTKKSV